MNLRKRAAFLATALALSLSIVAAMQMTTVKEEAFINTVPNTTGATGGAMGTGFFVTKDGTVVTNNHVVDGFDEITVVYHGHNYPAKVLKRDPVRDIAVLKIDGNNFPAVHMASRAATPGEGLCVVGYPAPETVNDPVSITCGISQADPQGNFQRMKVSILPGNSGSPVFNMHGEVVGIAEAVRVVMGQLMEEDAIQVSSTSLNDYIKSYTSPSSNLLLEASPAKLYQDTHNNVVLILSVKHGSVQMPTLGAETGTSEREGIPPTSVGTSPVVK